MLELDRHKHRVASVYNLAAAGYDRSALRFFRHCAHRLVSLAGIRQGQRVLDVATGTGAAALIAASVVGAAGHVVGIDIATEMLAQAHRSALARRLSNLEFVVGDAERLEFDDGTFDVVLCASGIFLLPDMVAALGEWLRVTKPGGVVAFQGYGDTAFQPMSDLFEARIRSYKVPLAHPSRPFSWQRLIEPAAFESLLSAGGGESIEVYTAQLGYWLTGADAWWDLAWNSGFRGPLAQLTMSDLKRFQAEHLAEVAELGDDRGIWLDIPAIFALARRQER